MVQVHPLGHTVGPVYPEPPHWPYGDAVALAPDEVVVATDVVREVDDADVVLDVVLTVEVDLDEDDTDVVLDVVKIVEVDLEEDNVDEVVVPDAVDVGRLPLGSPYHIPLPLVPTKTLP